MVSEFPPAVALHTRIPAQPAHLTPAFPAPYLPPTDNQSRPGRRHDLPENAREPLVACQVRLPRRITSAVFGLSTFCCGSLEDCRELSRSLFLTSTFPRPQRSGILSIALCPSTGTPCSASYRCGSVSCRFPWAKRIAPKLPAASTFSGFSCSPCESRARHPQPVPSNFGPPPNRSTIRSTAVPQSLQTKVVPPLRTAHLDTFLALVRAGFAVLLRRHTKMNATSMPASPMQN
jgi:hypothetical protein